MNLKRRGREGRIKEDVRDKGEMIRKKQIKEAKDRK